MEKSRCWQKVESKATLEIKDGFVEFSNLSTLICHLVFEPLSWFSILPSWEFHVDIDLTNLPIMAFCVIMKRCDFFKGSVIKMCPIILN